MIKGRTILVVDDEPDLRSVVTESLEFEGALILQAPSGDAAFKLLQEQGPGKVDCVLSDIRMANGDGPSLLRSMRRVPEMAKVPFIFYSGYAEDISEPEAQGMGAFALVEKPFRFDEMIEILGRAIAKDE